MCGICGYITSGKDVNKNILKTMSDEIYHRGPDDEGFFLKDNIALAHRRLSIIDLNTGKQPIYNEDKSLVIVFNGEIYNFQELKKDLLKRGHKFQTHTDTEVIIHLYEEYKYNCVNYLRGMFSFAIYDIKNKELFLVRDRLGQKPLFYSFVNGTFYFASEIKAILSHPDFKKEPNLEAIHYYLSYKYIPHNLSGFKNIFKLPHSNYLVFKNNNIEIVRYWKDWFSEKKVKNVKEIKSNLYNLLSESVKLRMISDVPLGAFLSGGIDSSIIVALMSKFTDKVKTFSIGFDNKKFDETYYAELVAKKYNTEHYKFIVKPKAIEDINTLIWHYNEPFADVSMLPTFYLSRETRKYVKVALSGDAGDENFAGYLRYLGFKLSNLFSVVPLKFRKNIIDLLLKILPPAKNQKNWYNKFNRLLQILRVDDLDRYLPMIEDFSSLLKGNIYTENFKSITENINTKDILEKYFYEIKKDDIIHKLLYLDLNTYLPDDLMVKTDIASMAVSLECRAPLMDHKLVEYVSSIPSNLKLHNFNTKYIFKETFKHLLPNELLNRQKMGFGVPISNWFRTDLKTYVSDLLLSDQFKNRNLFKQEKIKQLLDEHINYKSEHSYRLWSLMCLELWFRKFF